MFNTNYITPESTVECNHRLRITKDLHIIWDVEHRIGRVEIVKRIVGYISPLGDETPWIEGPTVIKKGLLSLEAKFWYELHDRAFGVLGLPSIDERISAITNVHMRTTKGLTRLDTYTRSRNQAAIPQAQS
ncbi:hypothetical protein FXO38_16209 [Capsicum annuum]|nr:hypothetical protein FXO38_16209 [Capsicum annuum]